MAIQVSGCSRQSTVALSSAEEELMSASMVREVIY